MGNYSYLYATSNGAKKCKIHWELCKPFKTWLLNDLRESGTIKTLDELGHTLTDTKLIGYLDNEYIHDLCELSMHLECDDELSTPRLYFDYEGWYELYYIEFHPSKDIVFMGVYRNDHENFPQYPETENDEDVETYEKQYDEAIKALHNKAMDDVNGWQTRQLKEENVDAPGSALSVLCMMQGISPYDTKAVLKYLNSLPREKANQVLGMRVSDLLP
jgi:hypothetical protein